MYAVPLVSQEGWHGSTGELQVKAGALIRRKRIKEKYKYFSGIIMLFRHFTEKKIKTTTKNNKCKPRERIKFLEKECLRVLFIECFLTVLIINVLCNSCVQNIKIRSSLREEKHSEFLGRNSLRESDGLDCCYFKTVFIIFIHFSEYLCDLLFLMSHWVKKSLSIALLFIGSVFISTLIAAGHVLLSGCAFLL